MKRFVYAAVFTAALTAFTAYAALDTFVLKDVMQTDATEMNTAIFEGVEKKEITRSDNGTAAEGDNTEKTKPEKDTQEKSDNGDPGGSTKSKRAAKGRHENGTEAGRSDTGNTGKVTAEGSKTADSENYSIVLSEYEQNGTKIYVADIQVTSAEYVKTAFADDTYGRNVTETVSDMADRTDAVLAINGDYYGAQERGYVIRNGVVYRDSADGDDICCLYADGTLEIVSAGEKTAEELVEDGVWQAWSFGPGLVEDGEITVSVNDEVGRAKASNPRTAIGMIDSCHYVFVVSDGRTSESEGLSLYQLAQFMLSLGVRNAYNLDGGGSSTMVFEGEIVNNPTSGNSIKERAVSDMIYIG